MKNKIFVLICFVLGIGCASCDTDNYEAPQSKLEGRIVYNGEPIHLGYNEVNMQLWEPGWQLRAPIDVAVDQDGSYSAVLFNATYKLNIRSAQGPFRSIQNSTTQSDTIMVDLKGNQVLDIEVMPYYMIRNTQIASSARDITANFKLERIITDANAKNVERVSLYINKTTFVDRGNNIASKDLSGANIIDLNSINLSATVPAITPAQNYVFARVGVKIAGVEDMLYSAIQKIQL
ncbi:DUF3823 domain-containing protein [Adhaeribacter rhizoryzae]|uniref:DUF3823 domain-containing protein n=1 Tax=Adhaeribacter rhizoryzae TaxID=2607907 RepID=A0A5M6D2F6_9BACT|nr:DUF3823 domain-containing protein [Adhaeribacter rhizoryzae]KAA5541697.1 DUF3823 domain-containing protein [Adhaeribacter rhizoryzae]